jgi:hypothetical protein
LDVVAKLGGYFCFVVVFGLDFRVNLVAFMQDWLDPAPGFWVVP